MSQKEARKRLKTRKKARHATPQPARVQLPSIELSDINDMPTVVSSPLPIPGIKRTAVRPAKYTQVEIGYQLYAFVSDREVYSNAGQIIMTTFDYSSLCLKANAATRKFAHENGGELGKRSSKGFLQSRKATHYSKPLDDLEEWLEMDKLGLMLLESSTSKHI